MSYCYSYIFEITLIYFIIIYFEYFIIEEGKMWDKVLSILEEKARQVRLFKKSLPAGLMLFKVIWMISCLRWLFAASLPEDLSFPVPEREPSGNC